MLPLRGFSLGRPLNDEIVVESKKLSNLEEKRRSSLAEKGLMHLHPISVKSTLVIGRATREMLPLDLELLSLMRRTCSYQISCPHQRVEYD